MKNLAHILGLLYIVCFNAVVRVGAQPTVKDTAQFIKIPNFDIPQLGRQRTIRVYLPAGYQASHKKYPVLYLMDGQNLFKSDAAIGNTWAIDSIMQTIPAKQQYIIVAVDHGGKFRIQEYDPYDSKYGKGEGIPFANFLVETLKPYIDAHYRVKSSARYTAIAGSSMGALIAVYVANTYPKVFGQAGIFSPALWIAPKIYTDVATAKTHQQSGFYFTCGDKESDKELSDVMKMDSILISQKLSAKQKPPVKVNIGSIHNETQWRQAFPAFYQWLVSRF